MKATVHRSTGNLCLVSPTIFCQLRLGICSTNGWRQALRIRNVVAEERVYVYVLCGHSSQESFELSLAELC